MAFVASVSACLKTQLVLGVGKALLPKTGFSVWLVAKKPICTSQPFSAAGVRVGQAVAFRVLLQPLMLVRAAVAWGSLSCLCNRLCPCKGRSPKLTVIMR